MKTTLEQPSYPADSVGGKLHKMMTDRGLWPQEADAILEVVRTDEHTDTLAEILGKKWDGYPEQLHAIAWATIKHLVVEYIDANKPRHRARPMFTE